MFCARITAFVFSAAGIIIPILLVADGLSSMKKGRNTGTIGNVVSLQQPGFSDCYAIVNYTSKEGLNYTQSVYVPCDTFLNNTRPGLPIYLCYNRWHPENVAFDDRGQHNSGQRAGEKSPWDFCSRTGYGSAKAEIIAAFIILSVLFLSSFGYAAYKYLPCPESGFKRFTGSDTQPVQQTGLTGLDRESMSKA